MLQTIKARMRMSWAMGLMAMLGVIAINMSILKQVHVGGDKADSLYRTAMTIDGAIAVTVIIGTFVGAGFFEHLVVGAIRRLEQVMRRLAAGEHDVKVIGVERRDELGDMARSVLVFQENAVQRQRLEAEAAKSRDELDRRLRETEAAFEAAGREQKRVVEAMARELSRLAEGDLTARMTETVAAEYEALKRDFNVAVEHLEQAIQTLSASTQTIDTGAQEITQATDDLSRRTEQQAASLEQTAAALDQITATVRRTADGAQEANKVIATARADAQTSGEIVERAVKAMSEIEASSSQIGQIIGVIDEIAFQTNLLALNAGVEAARAGESRKGFAVVASEVRALAQRSAQAAQEIKGLINASTAQVAAGVDLVGQTGEVLNRIVGHVAGIDAVVIEIAASAQEQSAGLSQVNTAVNHMDQMTQQNAAMVEQTSASVHALRGETGELSALVGRFRAGGSVRAPAARAPVRQKIAVGARRSAPVARASESWEEF